MNVQDGNDIKKVGTYKDMAYRSLRFLYNHPRVGEEKLEGWIYAWLDIFEGEKIGDGEENG